MTRILFPLLFATGSMLLNLRFTSTKRERCVSIVILLIATTCVALYAYGILGVGVSSWILEFFGKVGLVP